MDFYNVINKRCSIHNYKEESIPIEKIDRILEAAMKAPSWKNNTSYKIIVIDDKSIKKELSESIINSDDKASRAIETAPIAVVIVGNKDLSGVVDGKEYYLVDGAIAMEHLILAATEEELGTCWIGAMNEEVVKRLLCIPEEFKVIGMTPIGVPNEDISHYEEKPIDDYIYKNQWSKVYKENK